MNKAEQFTYHVCRRTFLSLWSHANPTIGKPRRELCDVLVVCDPHVVVISVKDVKLRKTEALEIGMSRWQKKAIDQSVSQLYGAARQLKTAASATAKDGFTSIPIPPLNRRRTHLLAVACGSGGEAFVPSGDFGKGYVHVMTEESFAVVLRELDTVSDLTRYLGDKEALLDRSLHIDIIGTEADLLAFYLINGRAFPDHLDSLLLTGDLWSSYAARPEVERKRKADQVSYAWDRLVNSIASDVIDGTIEPRTQTDQPERALRVMAREDRFARRVLGDAIRGLLTGKGLRARIAESPSGVLYVLMQAQCNGDREALAPELQGRCFLARGMFRQSQTVVGIAFLTDARSQNQSIMLCNLHMPEWTAQDEKEFRAMQAATGGFVNAKQAILNMDEYPAADTS